MDPDPRLSQLHGWIREVFGDVQYTLEPASEDASFRRYFGSCLIIGEYHSVDAPPEKESNEGFVEVLICSRQKALPYQHSTHSFSDSGYFFG